MTIIYIVVDTKDAKPVLITLSEGEALQVVSGSKNFTLTKLSASDLLTAVRLIAEEVLKGK